MSAAKHTPGPWREGKWGGSVVCDTHIGGINGNDDVEHYGGHLVAESIAVGNRPVIAAAPRLFDALETLVEALMTDAPRDFVEAFVRDGMAALEEAAPGWNQADEPTRTDMRRKAEVRAAAPDMLEALRNARDMIATDRTAFVDCSAIHELTECDDPDNYVAYADGVWLDRDDAEAVRDYDRALAQIDAAIAKATGSPS